MNEIFQSQNLASGGRRELSTARGDSLLSILAEPDPRYGIEDVPLSRFMIQQWYRFGLQGRFSLNTTESRLRYAAWYLLEHLPNRPHDCVVSADLLKYLNAPAFLGGPPISRLMMIYWQDHARGFDIFTEEGLGFFIADWIVHRGFNTPGIEHLTPSYTLDWAYQPQPGTGHWKIAPICRLHWAYRRLISVYERYDLHVEADRIAYSFDIMIHVVGRDQNPIFCSPSALEYWAEPLDRALLPSISRFMAIMLRATETGRDLFSSATLVRQQESVIRWFSEEVCSTFPSLAVFQVNAAKSFDSGSDTVMLSRPKKAFSGTDDSETDIPVDIIVLGPFTPASGLGSGMKRSVEALDAGDVNFKIVDFVHDNPAPRQDTVRSERRYSGNPSKAALHHVNGEILGESILMKPDCFRGRYNIIYPFWETLVCPDAHRMIYDTMDEIWVCADFVKQTYSDFKGPVINMGSAVPMPKGVSQFERRHFGIPDDSYVFLFSFDSYSTIHRKNPISVVKAFLHAFPTGREDVRLILKTRNAGDAHWGKVYDRWAELIENVAKDSRISIVDRNISAQELFSLKSACDCYVSLHRSEGFGYGPAEAMALGKPVIATNYSGNLDFCKPDNSFLVDYTEVGMWPNEYLYWTPGMVWAEPSVEHAAHYMRALYDNPEKGREVGRKGMAFIEANFSVEALKRRYVSRLTELGVI